jgi:peptidoglycan-associated lipoprotein
VLFFLTGLVSNNSKEIFDYFSALQTKISQPSMRNHRLLITIFLLAIITFPSAAQDSSEQDPKLPKEIVKAFDAYEAQEYFYAIELLKDAYNEAKGREEKSKVLFYTAESYRMLNDYKNAENFYEKARKVGYEDPIAMLRKGDMLKAQGEYEDAIEVYQDYKKENPTDAAADLAISSTRQAIEWKSKPSQYQVDNMKDLNSREMDFSVMYGGERNENDVLYFISSREESEGNDEDGWIGQSFMDIYVSNAERKGRRRRRSKNDEQEEVSYADLKWSTPVPLDESGFLNTEYHEGTATFDSRKKELYFTRCIKEKNEKLGCAIYVSELVGLDWKEPKAIIIGSDTAANVGHPSLSADDKFLYFVSDEYNSIGKHDIYVTSFDRRSDNWREPKNLGPNVNSSESEYYPVVHGDGYLYFSSNGHGGMGGLDVFRVSIGEDGMPNGDIENMKFPINTNFDDFHLVWEPGEDTKKGFVSSNRSGGAGSDDIYAVYRTPLVFNIEGVALSSKTKLPIPEATVKLDGSDGSSFTVTADQDGYYIFDDTKVSEDVNYKLSFEKKKFLSNTGDVSTIGFELDAFEYVPSASYFIKSIKFNKELDPIDIPIVLPNVFFDLAKWDLRPEAMQSLDSVVAILNNNPTIVIEMRSHTDYRDSDDKNAVLSQKRADTCVSYLVSKGISSQRLVARGMGESSPFVIPPQYDGYGKGQFEDGSTLAEAYIKQQSPEKQEVANQINRRTDFKVLRDDFVPSERSAQEGEGSMDEAPGEEAAVVAGEIYILTKSESLGTIARRYKINMRDLKTINGGLRGVRTFKGLQLKVEKDGNYEEWDATHYLVKRRDVKLKDIAKELDMDDDILEDLNPELEEIDIQPGLWIKTK